MTGDASKVVDTSVLLYAIDPTAQHQCPRIRKPLTVDQSLDVVEAWLGQPSAVIPSPGVGHLAMLRALLAHTGAGGNLVNDVHLAALAVENKATLASFDNDFGRFPSVRWEQPKP